MTTYWPLYSDGFIFKKLKKVLSKSYADVRIAISAAVTLSLSTIFSLIDSDDVSFWAVDVAIVFGVCGLVSNFADWRVDSDFSTFRELFLVQ